VYGCIKNANPHPQHDPSQNRQPDLFNGHILEQPAPIKREPDEVHCLQALLSSREYSKDPGALVHTLQIMGGIVMMRTTTLEHGCGRPKWMA